MMLESLKLSNTEVFCKSQDGIVDPIAFVELGRLMENWMMSAEVEFLFGVCSERGMRCQEKNWEERGCER